MRIKFAGSHIHKDLLKAGIAFIPEEGKDKCFDVQYVEKYIISEGGYPGEVDDEGAPLDIIAYMAWLEGLETYWETNPAFTHFIKINPATTLPQLESEIQHIFTPDVLKSADEFIFRRVRGKDRSYFSKYRKLMQPRERLGNGLVLPKGYEAQGLIRIANNRFRGLGGELDGEGKILDIKPSTITIGSAAIGRSRVQYILFSGAPRTYVGKDGPADGSGTLSSCEIYLERKPNTHDVWVGTFSAVTDDLTCRDSESIGDVAAGSMQPFSNLEITVVTDDYLGTCGRTGDGHTAIEAEVTGFAGAWRYAGECIDASDSQTFTLYEGDIISLYGEGAAAAAYYHGLKVQGVGELALCDVGSHPLRIRKGGTTYGIELVATDDPNASKIRMKTGAGIKAIRKYT